MRKGKKTTEVAAMAQEVAKSLSQVSGISARVVGRELLVQVSEEVRLPIRVGLVPEGDELTRRAVETAYNGEDSRLQVNEHWAKQVGDFLKPFGLGHPFQMVVKLMAVAALRAGEETDRVCRRIMNGSQKLLAFRRRSTDPESLIFDLSSLPSDEQVAHQQRKAMDDEAKSSNKRLMETVGSSFGGS